MRITKGIKMAILFGLVICGAFLLNASEMRQNACKADTERQEAAQEKRILYLTFDDGPTEYTDELLDILAAHQMKATFFMLETEMKRFPEAVQRIAAEGHGIGVHGVSHEKDIFYAGNMGPVNEMDQANQALEHIIGMRTHLARTPYGSSPYLTAKQESALNSKAYILWDWNIDSKDWCYRNASKTFNATTRAIEKLDREPKVILFHDIKQAGETMKMMTKWMEQHHYTSEAITTDLEPVKLHRKK